MLDADYHLKLYRIRRQLAANQVLMQQLLTQVCVVMVMITYLWYPCMTHAGPPAPMHDACWPTWHDACWPTCTHA